MAARGQAAAFDSDAHRALAQEAAEAVVLLRNDGLLPLAEGTRIAVVGLLTDECKTDWYSGTLLRRSTPLTGLRERFGAENVAFAEGADRVRLHCADGWLQVPGSCPEEPAARGPRREPPHRPGAGLQLPLRRLRGRPPAPGELPFTDCGFHPAGVRGVAIEAAGEGSVQVGECLITVADTGGPYHYARYRGDFSAAGVGELRVRLRGAVPLASMSFAAGEDAG